MDFAKNLQAIRKRANLSQEDVAERLHISRQAVSKWEMGQSTPDMDTCVKLCEILKVTPDQLLLGVEANKTRVPQEKNNQWITIFVVCTAFLMVMCVCGTIILVCNLYNGEIFEPIMHQLAWSMINGSLILFGVSVAGISAVAVMRYLRRKRSVDKNE